MVSIDDDQAAPVSDPIDSDAKKPRDFYYYYGDLVYPLTEHESPCRIYADADAMIATARYWVMCQIVNVQGAFYGEPGTWMRARYSQLIDVWADAMRLEWPVRYNGRRLAMVIRQWVEEEQSAYVAEELRHSDEWNSFVRYAREHEYYYLPSDQDGPPPSFLHSAAIHLERAGLPSNPSTARYFLAVVNGKSEPLPARGVLVTTLCYMTPPYSATLGMPGLIQFVHPSETTITGITQWMPGTLLARVNAVVRMHREFMEANEAGPYVPTHVETSYQARQLEQKRMCSEPSFDYVEAAIREIRKREFRPTNGTDARFVAACDASYRATKGRIRRHNERYSDKPPIPSTPSLGWRREVLEQVR